MKSAMILLAVIGGLVWWMLMGEPNYNDTLIAHYPLDDDQGLVARVTGSPLAMDYAVSSDGKGSLRIDADGPGLYNLYHLWGEEQDLSFRQLVYEAKVRTQGVDSPVFLVMQAGITSVPGGEIAVIGREDAILGDNEWTTMTLAAGNSGGTRLMEATLQLQMDGPGTVWIDDIRLINRQVY